MCANGITAKWWLVKQGLMKGMKGRVLWQGQLSDVYEIFQGNTQRGKCNPSEHKEYLMDLLIQIFCSQIGLTIGSIKIPGPSIADDMIICCIYYG